MNLGGETAMQDREKIEDFRTLLENRKNELLLVTSAGTEAAAVVELDQTKVGRLSRMDALQAQAMSVETNRRRGIELRRIDAALMRIENDEYGYCLNCGEPIATGRLHSDPATPVCIGCAL